jgi:AraC-like DNA-binding protein
MNATTLEEFYQQMTAATQLDVRTLLPDGINREIGHFNVFNMEELLERLLHKPVMPYNRRAYYKISLISGRNRTEYADKVIDIEQNALLFATPKVPYLWQPQEMNLAGYFCVFTGEFLVHTKSGVVLDDLPIFKPGGYPVFELSDDDTHEIALIFKRMQKAIASDYTYKYDLLRTYVLELIHYGQHLQPATALYAPHSAAARVSALFVELLERQFPIESPQQTLSLRSPGDYADRLAVHVNHLNKVLREATDKTTTELIRDRLVQEAKILLKQTNWTVTEIAYSLGFGEAAYFSTVFRQQTSLSPVAFRQTKP